MTDSMIERVALALLRTAEWSSFWSIVEARAMARAAIQVMRDPTDAMMADGAETLPDYEPGTHDAALCWRAMIDAALSEDGATADTARVREQ